MKWNVSCHIVLFTILAIGFLIAGPPVSGEGDESPLSGHSRAKDKLFAVDSSETHTETKDLVFGVKP